MLWRLMSFMKVIDDKICFRLGGASAVYELFPHARVAAPEGVHAQKSEGRRIHGGGRSTDADVVWSNEISNAIWDVKEFVKLDDTILKRIEWRGPGCRGGGSVRRIRPRPVLLLNEYSVPEEDIPNFKPVTEADITSCQGDNAVPGGLKPEDIVVHNMKIDYSMKNKNPVDSVNFFQEYPDKHCFHIDKSKVS